MALDLKSHIEEMSKEMYSINSYEHPRDCLCAIWDGELSFGRTVFSAEILLESNSYSLTVLH